MYSQCSNCFAYTLVDAAMLTQGRGTVCCSACGAHYFVLSRLSDDIPSAMSMEHPAPGNPLPQDAPVGLTAPEKSRSHALPAPLPGFVKPRRPPAGRHRSWLLCNMLLALSFAAQIAYVERAWLLDNARLRPWLDDLCSAMHCTLPLRNDTTQLALLARDIRPHPSVPDALIISATLRNDAVFAQAFPHVEISLSDLDEHRIAMRRFTPRDYVTDSNTVRHGLPAGRSVALVFEVTDPGKNAVAFEFKFY